MLPPKDFNGNKIEPGYIIAYPQQTPSGELFLASMLVERVEFIARPQVILRIHGIRNGNRVCYDNPSNCIIVPQLGILDRFIYE